MEAIKTGFNKFMAVLMKFASLKGVVALKDGFILTVPITLAGSIFLLLSSLPIPGYSDFMAGIFGPKWSVPLSQVSSSTFDIIALLIAIGLPYKYAENEGYDSIGCGLSGLVAFLIVTATETATASGEVVTGIIPKLWIGGQGVITAIIMGFISSLVFCWCMKKNIRIKMPDSVPEGVSRAFAALIPGFFIFLISTAIYSVCVLGFGRSLSELIFKVLQIPLMAFSSSLGGAIVLSLLITLLFWAGVHGPNVVGGVMEPVWLAASLANQAVLDAGEALVVGENAYILTWPVFQVYIKLGGCGMTLGLLIAAFLSARSAQMKTISRLAVGCGAFNVNEPIIFGLPVAFNPYYLVPFSLVPVAGLLITYFSIRIGFMAPFNAVQVPWTTPPLISGLLMSGLPGLITQIIILAVSVAIYFPFVKAHDNELYKNEQAAMAGQE